MNSAEQSFRESLRSFNASSNTRSGGIPGSSGIPSAGFSFGPHSDPASESLLGSFRTRTQNAFSGMGWGGQQQEELFGLTRMQRLIGFIVCLGLGIFCFMVAFFTLPMLAIRPAKFATLYTLGSILSLTSFALLQGPRSFLAHIFTKERLPFTAAYLGSMILTLYFAVGKGAYVMTIICSVIQILALLWYFGSYLPGGLQGLGFMTRYFARNTVGLPV
ncbi:Got1/Sft2-like family-domain-containing protein [Powellomyces hirtus]|nr:Got1/Sft2-like family-domain-containing protein [Powellomyces hirtus]